MLFFINYDIPFAFEKCISGVVHLVEVAHVPSGLYQKVFKIIF